MERHWQWHRWCVGILVLFILICSSLSVKVATGNFKSACGSALFGAQMIHGDTDILDKRGNSKGVSTQMAKDLYIVLQSQNDFANNTYLSKSYFLMCTTVAFHNVGAYRILQFMQNKDGKK